MWINLWITLPACNENNACRLNQTFASVISNFSGCGDKSEFSLTGGIADCESPSDVVATYTTGRDVVPSQQLPGRGQLKHATCAGTTKSRHGRSISKPHISVDNLALIGICLASQPRITQLKMSVGAKNQKTMVPAASRGTSMLGDMI